MSFAEAVVTDPQQRLLLETNLEALLETKTSLSSLNGSAIGAYVGISTTDYSQITRSHNIPVTSFSLTAASASYTAGRIAFSFGLGGPTASIDTACSSSLVATHMALTDFTQCAVEGALVSGALLCLTTEPLMMLARSGLLSEDGRCKTFDASADGYVRAESCRTLFLERLSTSQDTSEKRLNSDCVILAALESSYVNSNAKTVSLIAPSGQAQQALLRAALSAASLSPAAVDALQTHANGTSLGDPIEIGAINAVLLGSKVRRFSPLMLSTAKGYGGHQEAGAGAVGLLEGAALAAAASIGPAVHLRSLNPHVAAAVGSEPISIARGGPLCVPSLKTPDSGIRVGVSSFGANGTNSHVILSAYSDAEGQFRVPNVQPIGSGSRWEQKRFWVTSRVQVLISSAGLRALSVGPQPVAILQSNLMSSRLAYLWNYSVHRVKHLPIAALLSMSASCFTVLSSAEDFSSFGIMRHCTAAAPMPMPSWRKAKSNPNIAIITMGLEYTGGVFETVYGGLKLLSARLEAGLDLSKDETRFLVEPGMPKNALWALKTSISWAHSSKNVPLPHHKRSLGKPFAHTAALKLEDVSGYTVHPVHLETTLSQQSLFFMRRQCAASWVKSIRAIVIPQREDTFISGTPVCNFKPSGLEVTGHASFVCVDTDPRRQLSWLQFSLHDVRIQEHDLPSAHPKLADVAVGPFMSITFGFEAGEVSAADASIQITKQREAEKGAYPLAHMTDEELSRHLTRIVAKEVKDVMGYSVPNDEPLMAAGMDSRGGMELRRTIAAATQLPLPVTMLYDYPSISAMVGFLTKLARRQQTLEGDQPKEGVNLMPSGPVLEKAIKEAKEEELKGPVEEEELQEEALLELEGGEFVPARRVKEEEGREEEPAAETSVEAESIRLEEEVGPEQEQDEWSKPALPEGFNIAEWRAGTPPDPEAVRDKPSELLKVLRPPPRQRPFFLAAPGVNTAQAAYFAFVSRYLEVRQMMKERNQS